MNAKSRRIQRPNNPKMIHSANPQLSEIQKHVTRLGRHLRRRDTARLAGRSLWVAALLSVVIALASRFWPLADRQAWVWLPLGLWGLAMGLYALMPAPPTSRIARRIDEALGLKDRLATTLELQTGTSVVDAPAQADDPLKQLLISCQLADATALIQTLDPRDLRWTISRRSLGWAGGLLALALTLTLLPNPMDALLAERAAIRAAAQEEAQNLQETRRDFEADVAPTTEERAAAIRELQEVIEALSANPGDLEQALADLSAAEAELAALQDPLAAPRQAMAEQVAARLNDLAGSERGANTDLGAAAESLMALAAELGALDEAAQADLAAELSDLAAQAAPTEADLAEALSQMAAAVRQGDIAGAANTAGSAQGALAQLENGANQQAALQNAQNALQASRQGIAQAAAGQGQAQGQGQGQSPGGGGGSTANQLPGSTRTGSAAAPNQPNKPATVSESETVYAPNSRLHLPGDPDFIAGQQTEAGQTIIREEDSPLPGSLSPAVVPYRQVYQDYATAATEALNREQVPVEWQGLVKDYFSQLAP